MKSATSVPPPTGKARDSIVTTGSTDALPLAPALGASLDAAKMPRKSTLVPRRILLTSALAILLGVAAAEIAQLLMLMINLITDICFYGRVSDVIGPTASHAGSFVLSPADNHLGAWVIAMPVIGGLAAGVMARWGSRAIQGHGIPEAMERILEHESNIPARVTWLKPLSSAFAIGTGGPFGAEGPIISTGGALGSLLGQLLRVTAQERKTLLAAGAAAGMAAVFGAPIAALAMAVELLLFELRPRSLIPVALATVTATGVRYATYGADAVFAMPTVVQSGGWALASYIALGAVVGYASVWVTKAVYSVEDAFGKLPIHWMWWPALGAVVAGIVGWIQPRTLGVGYDNIDALLQGQFGVGMLLGFGLLKFTSWVISLGSGTSGGTLAPLFMIGGSMGALVGIGADHLWPSFHVDLRIAALVGMGAIFAGSSRALLTAIIFCFETTRQPAALLPLLGGCTAAYLISALTMRNTIMTEKIARRGVRVPAEYSADALDLITVEQVYNRSVTTLNADDTLESVLSRMRAGEPGLRHHGYPVVDADGKPCGALTLRDLLDPDANPAASLRDLVHRAPLTVHTDETLRDAADRMALTGIGRLLVVERGEQSHLLGLLTRGDLISAHSRRLHEVRDAKRQLHLRKRKRRVQSK